jgi:hypothetical protein
MNARYNLLYTYYIKREKCVLRVLCNNINTPTCAADVTAKVVNILQIHRPPPNTQRRQPMRCRCNNLELGRFGAISLGAHPVQGLLITFARCVLALCFYNNL